MYHRVVEPKDISFPIEAGMYVRPETFAAHAKLLSQNYNVIDLDSLVEKVVAGEQIPKKTIALTFDDGWIDNYNYALPILEYYKLPATVFLATGFVGHRTLFWTDRVAASLKLNKTDIQKIVEDAELDDISSIEAVIAGLKTKSIKIRNKTVSRLAKGAPAIERQFMNWQEALEMANKGVRLACHSHEHEFATFLSEQAFTEDTEKSLSQLEEAKVKNLSSVYCYPGGKYSKSTNRVLKKLGFKASLAVHKESKLDHPVPVFGRVGIHEDISKTTDMFEARLYL